MKADEIRAIRERMDMIADSQRRIESLLQSLKPALMKIVEHGEYLMTMKEAARYLGVGIGTLRTWTKDGRIKRYRRGRMTGYLKSELDKEFEIEN